MPGRANPIQAAKDRLTIQAARERLRAEANAPDPIGESMLANDTNPERATPTTAEEPGRYVDARMRSMVSNDAQVADTEDAKRNDEWQRRFGLNVLGIKSKDVVSGIERTAHGLTPRGLAPGETWTERLAVNPVKAIGSAGVEAVDAAVGSFAPPVKVIGDFAQRKLTGHEDIRTPSESDRADTEHPVSRLESQIVDVATGGKGDPEKYAKFKESQLAKNPVLREQTAMLDPVGRAAGEITANLYAGSKLGAKGAWQYPVGAAATTGAEHPAEAFTEAAVFQAMMGPIAKYLKGSDPSMVRRLAASSAAAFTTSAAVAKLKGTPFDVPQAIGMSIALSAGEMKGGDRLAPATRRDMYPDVPRPPEALPPGEIPRGPEGLPRGPEARPGLPEGQRPTELPALPQGALIPEMPTVVVGKGKRAAEARSRANQIRLDQMKAGNLAEAPVVPGGEAPPNITDREQLRSTIPDVPALRPGMRVDLSKPVESITPEEVVNAVPVEPPASARPEATVRQPTKMSKDEVRPSLTEFVRANKGINLRREVETGGSTGELDLLRRKESGTTGLVRTDGGGLTKDAMHRAAVNEGLMPEGSTPDDMVAALTQEATPKTPAKSAAEVRANEQGYSLSDAERMKEATPEQLRDASEYDAERAAIESEGGDASFDVPPASARPEAKSRKGEMGAVILPDMADITDAAKRGGKAIGKAVRSTGEWVEGQGLNAVYRLAPEVGDLMRAGSGVADLAKAKGWLADHRIMRTVREDAEASLPKTADGPTRKKAIADAEDRFRYSIIEEQVRSKGATQRGNSPRYDELFPTEEAQNAYRKSPTYLQGVAKVKRTFGRIEQLNMEGGNLPEGQRGEGRGVWTGVRTNMVPLTTEQAAEIAKGGDGHGKRGTTSAGAIAGPRVERSGVAKEFTGRAEAYDPRLSAQFGRGIRESGQAVFKKHVIEQALANGQILSSGERPVTDGVAWSPFKLSMEIPVKGGGTKTVLKDVPKESQVEVQKDGSVKIDGETVNGKMLWLHPSVVGEFADWFRQNKVPRGEGVGAAISRQAITLATSGIAEAGGHVLNLAHTAVNVGKQFGLDSVKKIVKFSTDTIAYKRAQAELAKYGVSRSEYSRQGLGKYTGFMSHPIHVIDVAIRSSVMENVKERAAKQGREATVGEIAQDVLRAGNYNDMTQDLGTRFAKAWMNAFVVAGKTSLANAFKIGPVGPLLPSAKGRRVETATKLAAIWSGYLMYAGWHNYQATGAFMPKDIPFGATTDGKRDPKTGRMLFNWGPAAYATGIYAALKFTPLGGWIDGARRGNTTLDTAAMGLKPVIGKITGAMVLGGPAMRIATDSGMTSTSYRKASSESVGKAVRDGAPLIDFIETLFDKTAGRNIGSRAAAGLKGQFQQFGDRKGLSPSDLYRIRTGAK